MKRFFSFGIMVALGMSLCGCMGELKETDKSVDYHAGLALPVGRASFGLGDLLNKFYEGDEIYSDASNHYYFKMKNDNAFSFRDIELLAANATVTSGEKYNVSTALGGMTGTIDPMLIPESARTISINDDNFIDFNITTTGTDECIDSAGIETSTLFIRFSKPSGLDVSLKSFIIEFPMYDYDTREKISITLPNAEYPSVEFDHDYYFDINNFMVKIEDNPLNPGHGGFKFNVKLEAVAEGGSVAASDEVGYDVTYTIFQHKVVYGKFSADASIAKTTVPLNFNLIRDINNGKTSGALLFEDMDILLTLYNYDIGMKINMTIDTIRGVRRDFPGEAPRYAKFDNGYNYGRSQNFTTRPLVPFSNDPAVMTIRLNQAEAQLQNFFQPDYMTDRFVFVFSAAVANMADPVPMFVSKDAHIDCDVEFTIPLNLRPMSYYVYTDTIRDFGKNLDSGIFQYVDTAELYIGLENGLPIGASMSLYFVAESGDTLYAIDKALDDAGVERPLYVPKSPTNTAGEVLNQGLSKAMLRVVLDKGRMEDLRNSKYILYTVRAANEDTTDNIYFKDSDRFNISLKLFAKAGYSGTIGKKEE